MAHWLVMVKLLLFAQAREAASLSSLEISADTVGEVLEKAAKKLGQSFEVVLESSNVWLNGKPTKFEVSVSAGDEVAVIPPVSGG